MRPKPIFVKILAAVLVVVAAVFAAWALIAGAPLQTAVALVGLVGAMALWSADPRSRCVVYFSAAVVVGAWVLAVLSVVGEGWPYSDTASNLISLLPGILLLVLCGSCCVYVARHFRRPSRA